MLFIERLHQHFPTLPIERIAEFGSSKKAMQILIASGVSRKERHIKGRLDKAAAAIFASNLLRATLIA